MLLQYIFNRLKTYNFIYLLRFLFFIVFLANCTNSVFGQKTFHSYQNGNWNDPNVWTLDPSATVWVNPSNGTPAGSDQVVIHNGRRIKANGANRQALILEVDEGGTLDLQAFTGHNFATVRGQGLIRIGSNSFPAGNFSQFVSFGAGTIEFYPAGGFTFQQLTYNNLIINLPNATDVALMKSNNFLVHGNFTISSGSFQINDNTAQSLNLEVDSNIYVAANGRINVGSAVQQHNLTILGDLTNYGIVRFTDRTSPDFLNDGNARVHVHFTSALHNQSVYMAGPTTFYRIHCLKGIDDTYTLNLDATDTSYFKLLGPNNFQTNSPGTTPNIPNANALGLESGTLRLGQNIIIPCLASSNDYQYNVTGVTAGTREYAIDLDATLWIDGATVYTNYYAAPSNHISAFNPIYGKLKITAGSLIDYSAQGIGLRITGQLIIQGGTVNATVIRTSAENTNHRGAYRQTGGYVTIRRDISTFDGFSASFHLGWSGTSFNMSGGTLEILKSTPLDATYSDAIQYIFCIASNPQNISVTGGNIILHVPSDRDAYISTKGYFNNLTIISDSPLHAAYDSAYGGSSYNEAIAAQPLLVTNNFTITGKGIYKANNYNLLVGNGFTIDSNAVYVPGQNTTYFNGITGQVFSNSGTISGGLNNLSIINSSNTSITNDLTISNNLSISANTFLQDMGKVIKVNGNILNSGTHTSQASGRMQLEGTKAQTIGGSGTGAFGNLALNKTAGSVSLIANTSIDGNLRLANTMALFDLGYYNLQLSATSGVFDDVTGNGTAFNAARMIRTAGLRSDGGLTRNFNSTGDVLFPIGVAAKYTPVTLTFNTAPAQWGSVTVRPVNAKHSFVTNPNALSYYWRLNSNGFSGIVNSSVSSKFVFVPGDVNGTISLYIPGYFNTSIWTYINNISDVIDNTGEIYFRNQSQVDADYTAGEISAFDTVLTYYSLGGNWADFSGGKYTAWTNDTTTNQAANSLPAANNAVVIRSGHNIIIPVSDHVSKTVGSLVIKKNAILDLTTTTGHNFGALDKEKVLGSGTLRISSASATAQFPIGDFGIFLAQGGGIVEYYSTGVTDFVIPSVNASALPIPGYNKLKISSGAGRIIYFPDTDLLVRDSLLISSNATGTVRFNTSSPRDLLVQGNISITGGTLDYNNFNTQTLDAYGNIYIASATKFEVRSANTACDNFLNIYGDLTNNGTFDMSKSSSRRCIVTFRGLSDNFLTGTGGITNFYTLTVDKGIDTTYKVIASPTALSFGITNQALFINNGTFRINKAGLIVIPSTTTFNLPSTGCLSIANGTLNICTGANDNNDLFLSGKLEVLGGILNIGTSGNNINNDIEYAGAGFPQINISGGALNVNGQIRRNATINTGALIFKQSGGIVTISGRNRLNSRALLEILNPGSLFNSSGGSIVLVNSGGTTFGDLYLNPETYNISGGTAVFGNNNTLGGSGAFTLFAGCPLYNLTVDATGTAKSVVLQSFPLLLKGSLIIGGNSSYFSTNNLQVSIGGNLQNLNANNAGGLSSGGYRPINSNQLTIFNGTSANQQISGNGANRTDFGNVIFENSLPGASVSLSNTTLRVDGDITVQLGILNNGNSRINLTGNLYNFGQIISGSDYIAFNSAAVSQEISGSDKAVYGNLLINNSAGVICRSAVTIGSKLNLNSGPFIIDDNLLTFSASAVVSGSLDSTHLIITNGTLSDAGVRKIYAAGVQSFTYPIGVIGLYTPVTYNVNSSSGGSITVKPVNAKHPALTDAPGNELSYYWNVASGGFVSPIVSSLFNYRQRLVTGSESAYVTGYYSNFIWQADGGIVNSSTHFLEFDNVNYIDGEYTAGAGTNFSSKPKLYSRGTGNWFNATNWSLTPGGASAGIYPDGNPAFILTGHTITMNQNLAYAYSVDIPTGAILDISQTLQHNLGHVTGSGTIKLTSTSEGSFIFPGGDYSVFMSANGSLVEYNGSGTLPPEIKIYQNVNYLGAATIKEIAAADYTVLGNLWIKQGFLDNGSYGRNISLYGNWTDNVSAGFLAGHGCINLYGSASQIITGTGTENFYKLRIGKSGSEASLATPLTVQNYLYLDSGYLHSYETNILSLSNASQSIISGGDSGSFVIGPLKKFINNGDGFLFPVGDVVSGNYRYGPVSTKNTLTNGSQYWLGRYYYASPAASGFPPTQLLPPIQNVSNTEYWRVQGPAGGNADVAVRWDKLSDFIPSTLEGKLKLRIVEWRSTRWEKAGDLVNPDDQTVETNIPQLLGTGFYTLGLESLASATITSGSTSICNNGSQTAISINLTGDSPWSLTYTINGSNPTVISNIGSSPYSLIISSDLLYPIGGEGDYTIALSQVKDKNNLTGVCYGPSELVSLLKAANPVISGKTTVNINETGAVYTTPVMAGSTYNWIVSSGSITAGQGTNSITVTWGPSATTGQVQVVQSVTVTGCQKSAQISVEVVVVPSPVISGSKYVCAKDTSSYSTPPAIGHTYIWSDSGGSILGSATGSAINIIWSNGVSGTIKVTEDSGSAKGSDSIDISINPLPLSTNPVTGDTVCAGVIPLIKISSAAPGLSYALFSNNTRLGAYVNSYGGGSVYVSPDTAPIVNRNYNIRALNTETGCGIMLQNQAAVLVYPKPTASLISSATQICPGTSVTFTGGGGSTYHFLKNGSVIQSGVSNLCTLNNLVDGDKIKLVAINSTHGCTDTSTAINITVNSLPIVSLNASATSICAGLPVIFTTAGADQYTFLLNGSSVQSGSTTSFSSSLLTDGSVMKVAGINTITGCKDTSIAVTITIYPLPVVGLSANQNPVCAGQSAIFTATNAVSYIFQKNGTVVQSGNLSEYTSASLNNNDKLLTIGTNSNGCIDTSDIISMAVNAIPVVGITEAESSICQGSVATFNASNADTYTFQLNGSNVQSGPSSVFKSNAFVNGDQVRVIGTNNLTGCSDTSSNQAVAVIHGPTVDLIASNNNICGEIPIQFTASGADQYTFLINGSNVQSGLATMFVSSKLTNNDIVRVAGSVSLTGCQDTSAGILMQIKATPIASFTVSDSVLCMGSIFTAIGSGADLYNYLLNGNSVQAGSSNIFSSSALNDRDQLKVVGTNTITGCMDTSSILNIKVNPKPVVNLMSESDTACLGSLINFSASGADQYTFKINGINVQSGLLDSYSSSGIIDGDKIWVVGMVSSDGCFDSSLIHVIKVNPLPDVNLSSSELLVCAKTPVTFTASGADEYSFYIQGSLVQSGNSASYSTRSLINNDEIYVLGSNSITGCSDSSNLLQATIKPTPIVNISSSDSGICTGSHINFNVSGADNYSFMLNGVVVQSGTQTNWSSSLLNNNDVVSAAGEYSSDGCIDTSWAIKIQVHAVPIISWLQADSSACLGAAAYFQASGADMFSFYLNGALAQGPSVSDEYSNNTLSTGDSIYSIGSIAGCPGKSTILPITINPLPPKPVITPNGATTFYFGDSILLSSSPANGYLWSPGGDTSRVIAAYNAGNYQVSEVSDKGCVGPASDPVTININYLYSKPTIAITGDSSFCKGGSVILTSSAGPLYIWSDGSTSQSITVSQAGKYSVTIRDSQGRKSLPSDSLSVTIYQLPVISSTNILNVACTGDSTGSANVSISGGTAPFRYEWSTGQSDSIASGLSKGIYDLIITDFHNCMVSGTVVISQPDSLKVFPVLEDPRCSDAKDGSISLNITGGVKPYSVSWNSGENGTQITGLEASNYSAIITDANQCSLQQDYTLVNQLEHCLVIPTIITPNKDGHNDTWQILGSEVYPGITVEVFDRRGKRVYYSEGYPSEWDGTFDGKDLPMDSYHYVINLHNGKKPLIGLITIVR